MSWIFRNFGDYCPVYVRWFHIYAVFYVLAFHYLRPIVAAVSKKLPSGAVWATASLGASMTIGVLMAMYHYPNYSIEDGSGMQWVWLEVLVDVIQPSLFALGMTHFPFNLSWWGNTTLGCYCFHFYFRDQMTTVILSLSHALRAEPTGIVTPVLILLLCLTYTTICGPIGHYILLSPTLLYSYIMKKRRARNQMQRGNMAKKDVMQQLN